MLLHTKHDGIYNQWLDDGYNIVKALQYNRQIFDKMFDHVTFYL